MNIFQAIILSIVEGVTEFLPISSTGHLTLATHLLKIPESEFVNSFIIIIQLGAIAAVALIYFKRLVSDWQSWKRVLVAFLPASIIGFALYKSIKSLLIGNQLVVVLSLIIGGVLIIIFDKYKSKKIEEHTINIQNLPYKNSLLIGLFQAISIIPGVSRSASTIIGGIFQGLSKKDAVEFSFLLAIPTMLAATIYDLKNVGSTFTNDEYTLLAVGVLGSFITALVVIKAFLKYVESRSLAIFGYYRIVIGFLYYFLFLYK